MSGPSGPTSSLPKPELVPLILDAVSAGEPLIPTLRAYKVDTRDWYRLLRKDEGVRVAYAAAKLEGLDPMADDAIAIADDPTIDPNDKKIRVDTRKWFLSKLAPKKYGDLTRIVGEEGPVELKVTWSKPPE